MIQQSDNEDSSEESFALLPHRAQNLDSMRGVPQSQSSFPRGRSNFSSGTFPNRKVEATPVNTLATTHSSKMLLTTFRMDRTIKPRNYYDGINEYDIEEFPMTSTLQADRVNNFACPINRTYVHDYHLFPRQNSLKQDYSKRYSLPSTHILFGKTKHRGGPNIQEQEKVVAMLHAAARITELESEAPVEMVREPVRMELELRIMGPITNSIFGYCSAHMKSMKQYFLKCLEESGASEIEWLKTDMLPRAAYENQIYQIDARIVLAEEESFSSSEEVFARFARKFTRRTRGMMHDQIYLEVHKFKSLFPKVLPQHVDVRVSGISIGNCPNPGLFLIRGDYITQENTVCSVKLQPQYGSDLSRENSYRVAGNNKYLSYARFEHDRRVIALYFGVRLCEFADDGLDHAGFRLNLFYNQFVKLVVDFSQDKTDSVYIQMKSPPQLWEGIAKSGNFHPSRSKILNLEQCTDWMRVLTWPADAELRGVGCTIEAFSQSNWIRIIFKKDEEDNEAVNSSFLTKIIARIAARSNAKIFFGSVYSIRRKLAPSPAFRSVGTFRANYALQALITRGSVFMDQLFDVCDPNIPTEHGVPLSEEHEPLFLKLVRRGMRECRQAAEESLEQLLNAFDEKRDLEIVNAFKVLYNARKSQYERLMSGGSLQDVGLAKPLPKNCVSVAKVVVTPARVLLMAPEVMMVNRVVRKFGPDYALRCVFRDDNLGRLAIRDFALNNIDHNTNAVTESIYRTLRNGIRVADRLYSFLGWSNSQMRDQGCYLYAPRKDPITGQITGTVEEIRRWMGDFREAISVPKMMSRMGQCFTQAQPTVRLKRSNWIVENDIEGGPNNKFCFSDGCGRISLRVAAQITKLLQLKDVPACFQVRFKGFKGIVVLDPMIDQIINMPKIIFRKSQQKFGEGAGDLHDDYLEVVKYAMPSPVCLNRPFITILDQVSAKQSSSSHSRITSRVHYYLERELCLLSNMLINENQASEELVNRTSLPIDWIFASKRAGFQLTVDPFVRQVLFSIYRYNIIHHISKAKIFLPPSMGRSMYGVVDETGLLQHGQVFVQYSPSIRQTSKKPVLLSGKVLITKNPCHVPGDVRIFEAVWQPSLSHLVDVIVFPQHGPRPHPDEMAGSDLDGDEYSIIWDQEMILDHNEPAMVFPSSVAAEDDKDHTTDDMVEFFLRYLQQDSIGRMSHAHLAYADLHGLFHDNCHSIALKCAVAVDFPKSGTPAEPLAQYEQCDATPDYMMSGVKPMYYSPRLNGQLYRKTRKVEEVLEDHNSRGSMFEGDYDKLICPDDEDVFFGDEQKLFQALSVRDDYIGRMQQLLDEYGIEDEASVVSGHAASIKRLAGMERDDYSFYHTDKVVELRYEKLFRLFRAKFFEEFGGESAHLIEDGKTTRVASTIAMQEKARQWYFVSYVQPKKSKTGRLIGQSLPWVVWEALCDLRRQLLIIHNNGLERVKYPLSCRLGVEMNESLIKSSEKFDEFLRLASSHRDAYCVKRYANFYNHKLFGLLFLIKTWLEHENVLPSKSLNVWHIGRLLIRFSLGLLNGNPTIDFEKSVLKTNAVFPKLLRKVVEENETPLPLELDFGTLMIEFIRYLASQSFALSTRVSLRVFSDADIVEPVLLQNSQWLPLHHVAYRTFHSLAVSGMFDALRLSDVTSEEIVTESRDPILVSESLFSSKNYNDDNPINRTRILQSLKEWSGVKEIIVREIAPNRKVTDLVYVTSVGTVLARQRLARLLLLSGETIRDSIANDLVPMEVRDECL